MKRFLSSLSLLFLSLLLALFSNLTAAPEESKTTLSSLVTGDAGALEKQKSAIEKGDPSALTNLRKLTERANRVIQRGPLSVIDKTQFPPSGDKRDYLSLGPYWWPDPSKEDGLPWIRKDGRVNPKTRGEHVDYDRKNHFFDGMTALSRAAYLTGNPKFGIAGEEYLEHWFIDPTTRMNPHLNYGQGIPGRNDGRPFGIIEWLDIGEVLSAIQILNATGHISKETTLGLEDWFTQYLSWLQNSELGKEESGKKNNHGTWYDVQVVSILLYLGKDEEARRVLDQTSRRRIDSQIEPDGRQPHELARTRSLSYSKMNLSAFVRLANFGERLGVDLWDHESPEGGSIRRAQEFLKPYRLGQKKWPYQQIKR